MTARPTTSTRPSGRGRKRAGAALPTPEPLAKRRVLAALASRFFIRCHVMLIALWALSIGVLASKLLWMAGMASLPLRYGLATVAAYLGFLLAVRLWLAYVGLSGYLAERRSARESSDTEGVSDVVADVVQWLPLPRRGPSPGVAGQGGTFDGGGASGNFDSAELAKLADGDSAATGIGDALEGAGDADDLFGVVLLVLGLLAAAVLGAVYVLGQGPLMLAEIAFEALLAGGMVRVARRADQADWLHAALRVSALPAISVAVLAVGLGLALQHWFPEAQSLAQALGLR